MPSPRNAFCILRCWARVGSGPTCSVAPVQAPRLCSSSVEDLRRCGHNNEGNQLRNQIDGARRCATMSDLEKGRHESPPHELEAKMQWLARWGKLLKGAVHNDSAASRAFG